MRDMALSYIKMTMSDGLHLLCPVQGLRLGAQQEASPGLCGWQPSLQTQSQITSCDTWKEKSYFSSRSVD